MPKNLIFIRSMHRLSLQSFHPLPQIPAFADWYISGKETMMDAMTATHDRRMKQSITQPVTKIQLC
jgi:hypothetical protein